MPERRAYRLAEMAEQLGVDEETLTEDLAFAIAFRNTRERLPATWALTVATTARGRSATASLFSRGPDGHARLVHAEQAESPTEALAALKAWFP